MKVSILQIVLTMSTHWTVILRHLWNTNAILNIPFNIHNIIKNTIQGL